MRKMHPGFGRLGAWVLDRGSAPSGFGQRASPYTLRSVRPTPTASLVYRGLEHHQRLLVLPRLPPLQAALRCPPPLMNHGGVRPGLHEHLPQLVEVLAQPLRGLVRGVGRHDSPPKRRRRAAISSSSITSTATTGVTTLLDIPTSALDLDLMQHSNTGRPLGQPQMLIDVGPGLRGLPRTPLLGRS
jgi:hypothetical protein